MHLYAVFLPGGLSPAQAAEKAELVRQGFNWRAFLATPLWALRRGYWLAFALWLAWTVMVAVIASFAHLEAGAATALYALGALAFGLEADRFRQARLSRSGYLLHGLTVGESLEEAESLYFQRHQDSIQPSRQSSEISPVLAEENAAWSNSAAGSDLLGLFPSQETKK